MFCEQGAHCMHSIVLLSLAFVSQIPSTVWKEIILIHSLNLRNQRQSFPSPWRCAHHPGPNKIKLISYDLYTNLSKYVYRYTLEAHLRIFLC